MGNIDVLCVLFVNFVDNVLKYCLVGVCVDVLMVYMLDGGVQFVVEDNGFGIFVEECECVFDCFYWFVQVFMGGSGLGLVIVCEIVQVYDVVFVLEVCEGGGLCVVLCFLFKVSVQKYFVLCDVCVYFVFLSFV